MPAFVLVTGYLSRSFTFTRSKVHALVTTIVVPYLVFETLLALFRTVVGHEDLGLLYLSPHWPMWYLSVLFLWRLATPLLNRVRQPQHRGGARRRPGDGAAAVLRRGPDDDP